MESTTCSPNLTLIVQRLKMGLSTSDMARMLGMKANAYKTKEKNKTSFNLNEMLMLSKLTGLNLEELFG